LALFVSLSAGCLTFERPPRGDGCDGQPPYGGPGARGGSGQPCWRPGGEAASECEGPTIRVKAPPQKIVIEQPGCLRREAEAPRGPEKEAAPDSGPAPEREKAPGRPEAARAPAPRPESAAGALAALNTIGQVAGLSRTTAMTSPLGTVNP